MSPTFHFVSGLPRSGSTLLAGILRQNPRFHAAMSSPVASLMQGCLEQTGASSEFYSFFDTERRKAVCRALFGAYYYDKDRHDVIFDTSRHWTARLHQLVELFDGFKVICCVRNPAWVMDSFERIYRKNPFDYSRMFSPGSRLTVYTRCETMMAASGTVGSAWTALKEAYYGEYSDRLLVVDYDTGASDTDNITSDTTPTFSGTAENGSTITLLAGAIEIGTATVTDGTWTITASALANGTPRRPPMPRTTPVLHPPRSRSPSTPTHLIFKASRARRRAR